MVAAEEAPPPVSGQGGADPGDGSQALRSEVVEDDPAVLPADAAPALVSAADPLPAAAPAAAASCNAGAT